MFLGLQGIKVNDAEFFRMRPLKKLVAALFPAVKKTYNGAAFISELPAEDCVADPFGLADIHRKFSP